MDKMYDVPKKKSKNLDPKFGVSINKKTKPKARPTVVSKVKGKPTPLKVKLTGKDAIKEFQKSISPKGMAKTKAEQTAALDALMKKRYGKKK
jgi:hypothetical protein